MNIKDIVTQLEGYDESLRKQIELQNAKEEREAVAQEVFLEYVKTNEKDIFDFMNDFKLKVDEDIFIQ